MLKTVPYQLVKFDRVNELKHKSEPYPYQTAVPSSPHEASSSRGEIQEAACVASHVENRGVDDLLNQINVVMKILYCM